LASYVVILLL